MGENIKISFFNDGTTNLYKSNLGIMDGKRTSAIFYPIYKVDSLSNPFKPDLDQDQRIFSRELMKFINRDSIIIAR